MTVGILTEKPSAARAFAKALGGMTGTYQGEDYVIANARGHLYELAEPELQPVNPTAEQQAALKSWDLAKLPWDLSSFGWTYVPMKGTSTLLNEIKTKFKGCDEIICAVDVDPSGEGGLIFTNIAKGLGLTTGRKISRMYFTDEAPGSLQKAFLARKPIPDLDAFDEYMKASFRSAFDFASIQWTRVASVSAAQGNVLRQGRLKSAIVKLVGDQLIAHNSYVRTSKFQNRFRDENGVLYTNPAEPIFDTKAQVPASYSSSRVIVDGRSNKRTAPRRLLDLAGLSARLSSKGIKADVVLATYQAMYEQQVVSYPRTDDKTITTEQFNELLPLVEKIAAVVGVDLGILTQRTPRRTHVKDSGAHGANRPGPKVPPSLDALKAKFGPVAVPIYEELARSYLAMLAEDYVYESQEGHIERWPEFTGRASVPKSVGWKQVFSDEGDADADENAKGLGAQGEPVVHEIVPPRPERPSMKWLMKQLEKRDVGTGATRTSTYAEVTSTKGKHPLLSETRGRIEMTEHGEMSHRLLPGTRIGDLGITEHVYGAMRAVAAGTTTAEKELAIVATWVREDIDTMQQNAASMRKELGLTEQRQQKEKHEGVWSVTGQPTSFNREWGGRRFTEQECQDLLDGKEIEFRATSARTGNEYTAKGKLEAQVFEKEGKQYPFVGFKPDFGPKLDANGKPEAPEQWAGHTFTAEQRQKLTDGEKVFLEGIISKRTKNPYDTTVRFGESGGRFKVIPSFAEDF